MPVQQHVNELFIGGRWVEPIGSELIDLINPANESRIARVPSPSEADAERAAAAARAAFDLGPWPRMSMTERAQVVGRLCDAFERRSAEFDRAWTTESGPTRSHSAGLNAAARGMIRQFSRRCTGCRSEGAPRTERCPG